MELTDVGVRVLVISFGVRDGAKLWKKDTSTPFTMLIDEDRKVYGALGLHTSVQKTWGTEALTYYAEQLTAGRQLPEAYTDVEDDPHQMGGNLLLDREGKVLLAHCSETATDRPSIEAMIEIFKKANTSASSTVSLVEDECEDIVQITRL